jgi:hypothetical protein
MAILRKLLRGIVFLSLISVIGGCEPKGCTLTTKTVEIRPAYVRTLLGEQYPTKGFMLCPFGATPLDSSPFTVIVGYYHSLIETFWCDAATDHIYQGAVWFPVAQTIGNKSVTKATLKFSRYEGDSGCVVKVCLSQEPSWMNKPSRNLVPVADCITLSRVQGDDYAIDVSSTVQDWASGRQDNKGFILVGPKENFDSFSFRGMLTKEKCLSWYRNFVLVVSYVEASP